MIFCPVICSLDFDEGHIDHFVDYYLGQGIDLILLILHSRNVIDESRYIEKYRRHGVELGFHRGDWNSQISKEIKINEILNMGLTKNDWVIYVDVDEHVECKDKTIREKIHEMETMGQNCCYGFLVDRISENGDLPKIKKDVKLKDQFPKIGKITHDVVGGFTRKVPIIRANFRVNGGHHGVEESQRQFLVINSEQIRVNHYKWGENIIKKLETRVKTHREKKLGHWRESQRFLDYWRENNRII
jgi:hypothetical protein